jgi:hypothetical protein
MAKNKEKSLKKKGHRLSQKQLLAVSIALSLTIAIIFAIFALQSSEIPFSTNAIIIDQLAQDAPNATFVAEATRILESRGFSVKYKNKSLDVEFFKKLAVDNYGIIVLRVHSAMREDNSTVDLFTSEEWVPNKYLGDLVVPGNYSYRPGKLYCAITSNFILRLEGRFPKSIVIAMGCWSLNKASLAEAFISKGAKAYVGWTDMIFPDDTDSCTITFLERLLLFQNMTLEGSIANLERTYPEYGITTRMAFHPLEAGDLTISDLLADAERSKSLMTVILGIFPFLAINVETRVERIKLENICQLLVTSPY